MAVKQFRDMTHEELIKEAQEGLRGQGALAELICQQIEGGNKTHRLNQRILVVAVLTLIAAIAAIVVPFLVKN